MGAGIPLFKSLIEEGMRATSKGQLDKLRSGATSARGCTATLREQPRNAHQEKPHPSLLPPGTLWERPQNQL
ncbi:hypothetical protein VB714_26565, partial [Spirulina sp. 06S082]|nr:hypothetical protein [Spirulina sp. 06S082]